MVSLIFAIIKSFITHSMNKTILRIRQRRIEQKQEQEQTHEQVRHTLESNENVHDDDDDVNMSPVNDGSFDEHNEESDKNDDDDEHEHVRQTLESDDDDVVILNESVNVNVKREREHENVIVEYHDIRFFIDFDRYVDVKHRNAGKGKIHILQFLHIGESNRYPLYRATPNSQLYVSNTRGYERLLKPMRRYDRKMCYSLLFNGVNVAVDAGLLFAILYANNGIYEENKIVEYLDGDNLNITPCNLEYINAPQKQDMNELIITSYNIDLMIHRFVRNAYIKFVEGNDFIPPPDGMIPYFNVARYKYKVMHYIVSSPSFSDALRDEFLTRFFNSYLTV